MAATCRQFFPSHCLDDWPVLPNELRRILKILRLHIDAAGLSASATRYLEIERINRGLRIFPMRLNIPAHAVSPPCIASNWDILGLQICLSCDANVAWADPMPARDSGNAADAFWGFGGCRHRPAWKTNGVTRQVARMAWLWQPDGLENGPSQAHTQGMSPAGYKFQGETEGTSPRG